MATLTPSPSDHLRRASDELLECFRRGDEPSLSDFRRRHPALGDDLDKLFQNTVRLRGSSDDATPPERSSEPTLRRVGDYWIVRELGRGGMGVVYEAEQESLGRRVALKVLPPSVAFDNRSLDRFRREARAAARLHHTNIVPVHEVGQEGDIVYYAMQFIEGLSLEQWMSARSRESLRLEDHYHRAAHWAEQIAGALAYAHERGIIHRDIKPSNLLLDPSGMVWITDFGLAKSIGDDATLPGDLMGTVRYMAPERFEGQGDHRADIYSLGLTLYELLLLRPAYPSSDHVHAMDRIRRYEPVRPRNIDPHLPRDLEVIVLKAIDKDPARRYQSAAELAEDLRRFQVDEPIMARPVTTLQRVIRAARRNPRFALLVGLVIVLGLTLILGGFASAVRFHQLAEEQSYQTHIAKTAAKAAKVAHKLAEDETRRANAETETAKEISTFLLGFLDEADPLALTGGGFGVRRLGDQRRTPLEMLDQCAEKLKTTLKDRPAVRAALLDKVGAVYVSFGEAGKARAHIEEALALRTQLLPEDHVELGQTWHHMGYLHHAELNVEEAEKAYRKALEIRIKVHGENHPITAETMIHLGFLYALDTESPDAEAMLKRALEIQGRHFDKKGREYGIAVVALVTWYLRTNELVKAAPLLIEGQQIIKELGDETKPATAINDFIQGQVARKMGMGALAAEKYKSALAIGEPWLGENHFFIIMARAELGNLYQNQLRDHVAAEKEYRTVLSRLEKFGAAGLLKSAGGVAMELGRALRDQRRYDDAEPVLHNAVAIMRKKGGDLGRCLHILGEVQFRGGNAAAAEVALAEAVEIRKHRCGSDKEWHGRALDYYVHILQHQGKHDPARQALIDHIPTLDRHTDPDPIFYFYHARRRGNLATLLGDGEEVQKQEALNLAMASLQKAVEIGYKDAKAMRTQTPVCLREHPEFEALLARVERKN